MSFGIYELNGIDYSRFLSLFLIALTVQLTASIFIALAVNEDAKIIGVKNRTLWTLLSFFIPVMALIYLCVRGTLEKTVPRLCMNCGETMPPNAKLCLKCGSPMLLDYVLSDAEKRKKTRRVFIILGAVLYVLTVLLSNVAGISLARAINDYTNRRQNQNDYYNEYRGGDESSDSDRDEAFDNFNNFGSEESTEPDGEKEENEKNKDKKKKDKDKEKNGDEDITQYNVPDDPFEFFDDFGDFGF